MSPLCPLLVVFACFHHGGTVEHKDWGLGRTDTISGSEYVAIIRSGDNILTPDWRQMSETCSGAKCLRYFKHCDAQRSATVCECYFGRPGDEEARYLKLSVPSRYPIGEIESAIDVLSDPGSGASGYALSLMAANSSTTKLPLCPFRREPSRCNP